MDVVIYTDGSCLGNPGPGGWAAILRWASHRDETELTGTDPSSTNNRMEMMAAIAGLEHLSDRQLSIRLVTDSQYVQLGMREWIKGWKKRDWRTAGGKPVLNKDLWLRLEAAAAPHAVEWVWVRGHNGHPENERVDALARAASIEAADRAASLSPGAHP